MATLSNLTLNLSTEGMTQAAALVAAAVAAEMEKHFVVEPTLSLAEAAEQLGLSVTVMRQLCRERKIPAIRYDKFYRIKVRDLNAYQDAHMIPAAGASTCTGAVGTLREATGRIEAAV